MHEDDQHISTRRKVLTTVAVVMIVAALGGIGAFSAFTATTQNDNNTISSGSVSLSDTDSVGGSAGVLYSASNQAPGPANGPPAKCIRVSYGGSLAASVRLYRSAVSNGGAFQLKIERGSGMSAANNTMSCSGFSSTSTAYNGTLQDFPTSFASSTVDGKASGATWSSPDAVDYRFTIYTIDDPTPNAHTSQVSTGAHSIHWEAQNN